MRHVLPRTIAGLAIAGAATFVAAGPAFAASTVPSGKGTAICGPSNGSYHARGGPGYAQYDSPPVPDRVAKLLCTPGPG